MRGSAARGDTAAVAHDGVVGALAVEGAAARALLLNLRAIISDDDDDLIHDTVEGETNLMDAIDAAVDRLQELEAFEGAIRYQMDALRLRRERFASQGEMIRAALCNAMSYAQLRKVERPFATVSLRTLPASVRETDPADIPSEFWKPQPPKLDKRALLAALKDGKKVPGAELSNGGETLSIRSK